jgi:glycerol-3-phosphate dehydrogenase subunit B
VAEVGRVTEPIFNLPVSVPDDREKWSEPALLAPGGQPFARFGLAVDGTLRPVDGDGNLLLENVFIAGCNLAGYDYCSEKSGNGVAVVSGYHAGMSA